MYCNKLISGKTLIPFFTIFMVAIFSLNHTVDAQTPSLFFDQPKYIVIEHSSFLISDENCSDGEFKNAKITSEIVGNEIPVTLTCVDEKQYESPFIKFSFLDGTDSNPDNLTLQVSWQDDNDAVFVFEVVGSTENLMGEYEIIHDFPNLQQKYDKWPWETRIEHCEISFAPPFADIDEDGICDRYEENNQIQVSFDSSSTNPVPGSFTAKCSIANNCVELSPSDPNIDPNVKDIFLEIDYVQGHRPNVRALQNVIDVFYNSPVEPIRLHIQLDDGDAHLEEPGEIFSSIYHQPCTKWPGAPWFGWKGFDQLKGQFFGTPEERAADSNWLTEGRFLKNQVYHYAIFVHDQCLPYTGSSGIAEYLLGDDFMISLGSFDGLVGNKGEQEGTLMHELGHNLNLHHGGNESTNCKPNYISVMNYVYQMPDHDVDRVLDYSQEMLIALNENALVDSVGVGGSPNDPRNVVHGPAIPNPLPTTGGLIDWDHDSGTGISSADINWIPGISNCPESPNDTSLTSHADWDGLQFNFILAGANFARGSAGSQTSDESRIPPPQETGSDYQRLSEILFETAPGKFKDPSTIHRDAVFRSFLHSVPPELKELSMQVVSSDPITAYLHNVCILPEIFKNLPEDLIDFVYDSDICVSQPHYDYTANDGVTFRLLNIQDFENLYLNLQKQNSKSLFSNDSFDPTLSCESISKYAKEHVDEFCNKINSVKQSIQSRDSGQSQKLLREIRSGFDFTEDDVIINAGNKLLLQKSLGQLISATSKSQNIHESVVKDIITIPTLKKQLKLNVPLSERDCDIGEQVVFGIRDGAVACITNESLPAFLLRDWVKQSDAD